MSIQQYEKVLAEEMAISVIFIKLAWFCFEIYLTSRGTIKKIASQFD